MILETAIKHFSNTLFTPKIAAMLETFKPNLNKILIMTNRNLDGLTSDKVSIIHEHKFSRFMTNYTYWGQYDNEKKQPLGFGIIHWNKNLVITMFKENTICGFAQHYSESSPHYREASCYDWRMFGAGITYDMDKKVLKEKIFELHDG